MGPTEGPVGPRPGAAQRFWEGRVTDGEQVGHVTEPTELHTGHVTSDLTPPRKGDVAFCRVES